MPAGLALVPAQRGMVSGVGRVVDAKGRLDDLSEEGEGFCDEPAQWLFPQWLATIFRSSRATSRVSGQSNTK